MNNAIPIRFSSIALIKFFFIIFLICDPVSAQYTDPYDLDYFDPRFKNILHNVERYHLSQNTFWKHFKSGKSGEQYAIGELKFVLRYFPNHPKALILLGSMAILSKTPSLAIPYYEHALKLYPQHALTHAQYGSYLVNTGKVDVGVSKLEHAIALNPQLAPAYAWLAKAYAQLGRSELEHQATQRARELGYKGKLTTQTQQNMPR